MDKKKIVSLETDTKYYFQDEDLDNFTDEYLLKNLFLQLKNDTDCTIVIQEIFNILNSYGKVICTFPRNGNYIVSKTLILGNQILVDFNNTTLNFKNGQYINGYGMLLSSDDGSNSNYTPANYDYSIVKNLNCVNEVDELKLFFVGSNIQFENIRTWNFWQFIKCTNNYIDGFVVKNVSINTPKGNLYQIDKRGQGDMIYLKNVHIPTPQPINTNGLYLGNSNGCLIDGWTNGNLQLNYCKATSIRNCHLEFGTINSYFSQLQIENNYFVKKEDYCIKLEGALTDLDKSNPQTNIVNNVFILDYTQGRYPLATNYDVDISVFNGDVFFNNNKRVTYFNNRTREYFCDISVFTTLKEFINYGYFRNKVKDEDIIVPFTSTSGNSEGYYNILSVTNSNVGNGYLPTGNYYYGVIGVYEETRKLGTGYNTSGKSVNVSSQNTFNIISLNNDFLKGHGFFFKVYKGTLTSRSYNKYALVPNSQMLLDSGSSVNGESWVTRTSGDVDTYNYCYGIKKINNVNVIAYCKAVPTVGTWQNGDVVYNVTNMPHGWFRKNDVWTEF